MLRLYGWFWYFRMPSIIFFMSSRDAPLESFMQAYSAIAKPTWIGSGLGPRLGTMLCFTSFIMHKFLSHSPFRGAKNVHNGALLLNIVTALKGMMSHGYIREEEGRQTNGH
jgi:hypothetical protein